MPTKGTRSSGEMKRVHRSPKKRTSAAKVKPESVEVAAPDEISLTAPPPPKFGGFLTLRNTSIRNEEINTSLRQLVMMLDAGTPLLRSLKTLSERSERPGIRGLLADISQHVERGNALWQAFERHNEHFDTVFVSLIRASEASGTLVEVMRRQIEYMERREILGKRVRRAMYYPIVLVVACALVILVLGKFVIPEFQAIFAKLDAPIPWYTKLLFTTTQTLVNWLFIVAAVVVIFVLGVLYKLWVSSPLNRLRVDRLKLRIPKVGYHIVQKNAVVEFTRSMALLLRSGLPMMDSLRLAQGAIHNQAMANVLNDIRDSVERGEGIEEPLRQARGIVPGVVTDMLITGEESGQLDSISEHIAKTYEEEVNISLEALGDMIQPILTVFIAVIVLIAALSLFVPIVSMIDSITAGA